jgi:CheY-like chemotaxis protein
MIAADGNRFLLAHKKLRRRGICMNVLVVEDEALVSLLMQEIVEQAGHACIGPAASVTEARALIDSRHVDAALLDIWLKYDEFVWPIARELARRGVPFAFVTARAADGIEPEFVDRPLFPTRRREASDGVARQNQLTVMSRDSWKTRGPVVHACVGTRFPRRRVYCTAHDLMKCGETRPGRISYD